MKNKFPKIWVVVELDEHGNFKQIVSQESSRKMARECIDYYKRINFYGTCKIVRYSPLDD